MKILSTEKGDIMTEKKSNKDKKKEMENLAKKLTMNQEPIWKDSKNRKNILKLADSYKKFLSISKTEREVVKNIEKEAVKRGFIRLKDADNIVPGMKIYDVNRGKNIILAVIGKKPMLEGINIVASHCDSPRIDIKQNPLYQDDDSALALFKTHYYGGLKKYQWVNIPTALHGTVVRKDGKKVDIIYGEKEDESKIIIPDLLPHLSRRAQDSRKIVEGIKGEEMNAIVGSIPLEDVDENSIKVNVLKILNKKYGISEEDFISAELELVPAGSPVDIGFDGGLIGAYGQDDRICVFTSMEAIFDIETPDKTAVTVFVEKEEIGSEGNTGMKSRFMEHFLMKVLAKSGSNNTAVDIAELFDNSQALSADVNGAVNPSFKSVHDIQNAAKLGFGINITKFTGSGGKYHSSDASAEFVGKIKNIFNKENIKWQYASLGKVDEGGGGTIAMYMASYNMDVLDCGPALISMHSPLEISSKADLYESKMAYKAFFEHA